MSADRTDDDGYKHPPAVARLGFELRQVNKELKRAYDALERVTAERDELRTLLDGPR